MSVDEMGDMILGLWEDDSKPFLHDGKGKSLVTKREKRNLWEDARGEFEANEKKRTISRRKIMDEVFQQDKENLPLSKKEERKLWKTVLGGRKRKSRKSRRSKKSKKGRRTSRRK